jgi:hypothetical protein
LQPRLQRRVGGRNAGGISEHVDRRQFVLSVREGAPNLEQAQQSQAILAAGHGDRNPVTVSDHVELADGPVHAPLRGR